MATIAASSASTSDVQTAVDAASDGDTVTIPNGSATWTTGITTVKQIVIRALNYTATSGGTMTRNVTITNNSSAPLFAMQSGNSYHVQISGIRFNEGTGTVNHVKFTGSGSKVPRLNDCAMEVKQRNGTAVDVATTAFLSLGGVAWNMYYSSQDFNGGDPSPYGTDGANIIIQSPRAWETASTMGSADTNGTVNVYIEDSTFYVTGQTPDTDDNGRVVVRYCTIDGTWGLTHGFSSTWGGRHFEYYNNTFSNTFNSFPYRNMSRRYFWVRAGTGIFTDNTVNQAANTSEWGVMRLVDIGDTSGLGTYPVERQPGYGHNGTAHVSDPIYIWNQSGAIGYSYSIVNGWDTSNVILDRDLFVNNGAKPGYTKYTYPHPLRSDSEGSPSGTCALFLR